MSLSLKFKFLLKISLTSREDSASVRLFRFSKSSAVVSYSLVRLVTASFQRHCWHQINFCNDPWIVYDVWKRYRTTEPKNRKNRNIFDDIKLNYLFVKSRKLFFLLNLVTLQWLIIIFIRNLWLYTVKPLNSGHLQI